MGTVGKGNILECLICGETHTVVLPMRLTYYIRVLKAFDALHKYCEEAKKEEIKE